MVKIFKQKNFNYFVLTPLGSRVNIYVNFCLQVHFKGTVSRDFCFRFFHESPSPKPLIIKVGSYQIFSKIRGDIRKSRCTTGVNDTGGKFATGVNDTGVKIADSRKKQEAKNLVTLSL